jgi:hypothetical protein
VSGSAEHLGLLPVGEQGWRMHCAWGMMQPAELQGGKGGGGGGQSAELMGSAG